MQLCLNLHVNLRLSGAQAVAASKSPQRTRHAAKACKGYLKAWMKVGCFQALDGNYRLYPLSAEDLPKVTTASMQQPGRDHEIYMGTATCVLHKPPQLSHQESAYACEAGHNIIMHVSASSNSLQQQDRSYHLPSSLTHSTSWLWILVGLVICSAQWQDQTRWATQRHIVLGVRLRAHETSDH